MEQFETTLTGSDSPIDGVVNETIYEGRSAYVFNSIDDTLHLIIARGSDGRWVRVAGSEPYLSGWVDELAEKITIL